MTRPGEHYSEPKFSGPLAEKFGDAVEERDTLPEFRGEHRPDQEDLIRMALSIHDELGLDPSLFLSRDIPEHRGALDAVQSTLAQRSRLTMPIGVVAAETAWATYDVRLAGVQCPAS